MGHDSPEAIQAETRKYIMVFAALAGVILAFAAPHANSYALEPIWSRSA